MPLAYWAGYPALRRIKVQSPPCGLGTDVALSFAAVEDREMRAVRWPDEHDLPRKRQKSPSPRRNVNDFWTTMNWKEARKLTRWQ